MLILKLAKTLTNSYSTFTDHYLINKFHDMCLNMCNVCKLCFDIKKTMRTKSYLVLYFSKRSSVSYSKAKDFDFQTFCDCLLY